MVCPIHLVRYRFPLYVDCTYTRRRWLISDSMTTEPPEYEQTLTLSSNTSRLDTDSETCLLSVPPDQEDGRASGTSTTFATPEGLTPKSSDEEGPDSKIQPPNAAQTEVSPGHQDQGFRTSNRGSDRRTQNLLNVPEVSSRLGRVLTGSLDSAENGLDESPTTSESERQKGGLECDGEHCVLSSSGKEVLSLKSEGSSTCVHSESGSQCTLTESRESGVASVDTKIGSSTQVQISPTGQTGHNNRVDDSPNSISPVGTEEADGNVPSHPKPYDGGMPPYYPTVPPHMLSINSSEWLGGSEVVTSQPQGNGYCRSGLGGADAPWSGEDTGGAREQPVAVMHSASKKPESEEGLSAGSGCYNSPENDVPTATKAAGQPRASSDHQANHLALHALQDTRQSTSGHQGTNDLEDIRQKTSSDRHGSPLSFSSSRDVQGRSSPSQQGHQLSAAHQRMSPGRRASPSNEEISRQKMSSGLRGSPGVSGLVMAHRDSPVGSLGTGSNTSDEHPLMAGRLPGSATENHPVMPTQSEEERSLLRNGWAKKKMQKVAHHPPSDLQVKREQFSPDAFYTPTSSFPAGHPGGPGYYGVPGRGSPRAVRKFSSEHGGSVQGSLPSPLSPGQRSYTSIASMDTVFSAADSSLYMAAGLESLRENCLPLVSTVDHVESLSKFKPGKGIVNFCKNTPMVTDLLYCLLKGRPLVLIGKKEDENLIRRLIRVLWLFVPGHSSQRQVVIWQETPLDIRDLSRVKLIGLCAKGSNPIGAHIKPYISYWDCSSGKLSTPTYNGDLIKGMMTRTKDKKSEEVFLTHIHSVLTEIAMKAYVYYHGYCIALSTNQSYPLSDHSPRKRHTVLEKATAKKKRTTFLQNLGIKNSDVDIIEYFVDVIREQQLIEWGQESANGGPYDDAPVHLHLQTKHCNESLCKPKRPY